MRIIFPVEYQHGPIKGFHIFDIAMLRALSFIMKDTFRNIIIHIASLHDPVRQIDIFAIHKERLIQQSHFI